MQNAARLPAAIAQVAGETLFPSLDADTATQLDTPATAATCLGVKAEEVLPEPSWPEPPCPKQYSALVRAAMAHV